MKNFIYIYTHTLSSAKDEYQQQKQIKAKNVTEKFTLSFAFTTSNTT